MFPNSFSRFKIVLMILGISLVLAVAVSVGYNIRVKSENHNHAPVVFTPQQQTQTTEGQIQAAHDAGYRISETHAADLAQATVAAQQKNSKETVQTTGLQFQSTLDRLQSKYQGNWMEVYDPQKPDVKPEQPEPQQSVTLGVNVVKAYPPKIWTMAIYPDWGKLESGRIKAGEFTPVAWRFKVFGAVGYVGPSITYDRDRQGGKLLIGPRIVGTF